MRKVMNKKGAFTMNQVLGLMLGLVVVVLIVLFATGAFGKIGDLFEKASSIEITAQACAGYASAGLESSYCNLFQKVDIAGTKQYVTCKYLESRIEVSFEKWSGECTSSQDDLAKKRCETLKDGALVNGLPCYIDGEVATPRDEWNVSKTHPS